MLTLGGNSDLDPQADLEWDKEPETGLTVDNKLEPIDISLAMSSLLSLVDFHWNPSNGDVVAQKLAHRQTATRKWDSAVVEDSVLKNRFPSSRKALASAWQCIAALCRVPPGIYAFVTVCVCSCRSRPVDIPSPSHTAYSLRERDSSSLRHASHFLQEFCSLGGLQVSLEIMRVENLPAELYNPLFELWCRYIYTDCAFSYLAIPFLFRAASTAGTVVWFSVSVSVHGVVLVGADSYFFFGLWSVLSSQHRHPSITCWSLKSLMSSTTVWYDTCPTIEWSRTPF